MSDPTKANPTRVQDAIDIANADIDRQAGGAGALAQATRSVLSQMNEAADAAIERQQGGGSGTP